MLTLHSRYLHYCWVHTVFLLCVALPSQACVPLFKISSTSGTTYMTFDVKCHILQLHMARMYVFGLREQLQGQLEMQACKTLMRSIA
jgi:hypothetical protein